jgi:hypothetical protein
VGTPTKEHVRAVKLREYDRLLEDIEASVRVLGVLVRSREARPWAGDVPAEVAFTQVELPEAALPAAVWVALRRDDTSAVMDALLAASGEDFLICQREEMGPGFRLQTVDETRPVPAIGLLRRQLGVAVGIPEDVVTVLGEWGVDDPRTQAEIDTLLDSRLSARKAPAPAPAPTTRQSPAPSVSEAKLATLEMTVGELADVLQLSTAQAKVLETLVRKACVVITP